MKISVLQYAQALKDLLADSEPTAAKKIIADFVALVAKNNDGHRFTEIVEQLQADIKKEEGELEVEIISARKLSAESQNIITNFLKKQSQLSKINIKETIDPEILGGFIIRYGDKIIDGSIKQNLINFKRTLNN
ncbi:MAG: ATP synthase F1 subunit delta [Patescibacteria group bacterium]|nr:ATP synthase F1 subunit delta [Patescibacteria group bacterium]MDD3778077.1 ATP synthase F1 subunit delta [Patescibacteria group bacterium]MDD3939255.1 ATP synthase F1 subunit delta [Patescibacteria group bacterium]MDD4443838.1 ATP synthase F1 subunit delta [Patescibacteria group bacterium]NCU39568.1 ATP synthase F1 subunit delta [Candidatus Falkowbacteria bacterium]